MNANPTPWPRGRLQRLSGQEVWAHGDQAVVSATNFLTNVMLARYMGLNEFGVFTLAWMSVLFVNSLQAGLMIAPMMSIGPQQKDEDRPFYFGAILVQELLFAGLCFLVVTMGMSQSSRFFPSASLQQLAFPLGCSALAYLLQDFLRRYFFATGKFRRAFACDCLSYPTQLPLIFLLHGIGHLQSATALAVLAGTSAAGIAAGCLWMEPVKFSREWIKRVSGRHWKFSRWLTGSALLTWTSSNIFVLAAPLYYGPASAGALKAAQNLMGATHVWFQGLDNVVPAEAARRLRRGGVVEMLAYIRGILFRWGGITLLFALLMAVAPGFWMRLIYGPQLVQFGSVLRLYALLYVLVFLGGPLRAGLQALEFTVPIFWSYLVMTAFAVVFAAPMAKWLGLTGTMLGLIATQILFQGVVGVALLIKSHGELHKA